MTSVPEENSLDTLFSRFPALAQSEDDIRSLAERMLRICGSGGTILTCGNGGSAADSDHVACELMKGFLLPRQLPKSSIRTLQGKGVRAAVPAELLQRPLQAVSLCSNAALITAISNDQGPDVVFAQQVLGLGSPGDLLLCLSTSGRSPSVLAAAATAKALGLETALLTGPNPGKAAGLFDVVVAAPGDNAGEIQDMHRPVYHAICAYVERKLFGVPSDIRH